jgi:hypothetical protein
LDARSSGKPASRRRLDRPAVQDLRQKKLIHRLELLQARYVDNRLLY